MLADQSPAVRSTQAQHTKSFFYVLLHVSVPVPVAVRSTAARLLSYGVRIPPGAWMDVVNVVCQVEVSATS
jgi:hypothetical protein